MVATAGSQGVARDKDAEGGPAARSGARRAGAAELRIMVTSWTQTSSTFRGPRSSRVFDASTSFRVNPETPLRSVSVHISP